MQKKILKDIIDYKDSRKVLENDLIESIYNYALKMLNDNKFDDAKKLFIKLNNYIDSKQLVMECDYQKVQKYLENKNYEYAYNLLNKLGDYKASKVLKASIEKETKYQSVLEYIKLHKFKNAKAILNQIKDFKDSKKMLKQIRIRIYAKIASLSIVGIIVMFIFYITFYSMRYTYMDYELMLLFDNTFEITDYMGDDYEIVIPSTYKNKPISTIGSGAFSDCDSLTSINVDINNSNYKSIDGNVYNKDGTKFIHYAVGKQDTSFTIPDSVTTIEKGVFYRCYRLTNISYNGTKAEWESISKKSEWNYAVPANVVHCTDGDVEI